MFVLSKKQLWKQKEPEGEKCRGENVLPKEIGYL
jgi:hypothetical protein